VTGPTDGSPLPGAAALDAQIEAHLAEFDAVPFEVRRTTWILAALVQKLTPAGVLQVLGFAHLVARPRLTTPSFWNPSIPLTYVTSSAHDGSCGMSRTQTRQRSVRTGCGSLAKGRVVG
jgi:hypothetical protein